MTQPNIDSIDSVTDYIRELAKTHFHGSITITFAQGVVILAKVEQTFKSNKVQTVISNRDQKSGENNVRNNEQQR